MMDVPIDLDIPYITFVEWLQAKTFLAEKQQMEQRKQELQEKANLMASIFS